MLIDLKNLPDDSNFLKQLVVDLVRKIEQLEHQLSVLRRHQFGRSSEKIDSKGKVEGIGTVKEVSGNKNGHGRKTLPPELPRDRKEIDITKEQHKCDKCGAELEKIGEEISEILDYRPSSLFVRQIVRLKYACKECEETVVTAEMPQRLIDKGMPGEGLLAHILVSKYADHLPLHRLEGIFNRYGIEISRSTMCGWVGVCADLLSPIYDEMKKDVLKSKKIHTDDTPVPVQEKGLNKTRTGRLWVYVGDDAHPQDVFDYTPDRTKERPKNFLSGFKGNLQADAYTGYEETYRKGEITEVACWAHTRRKFYDARETDAAGAAVMLAFIGQLYKVEEEAKEKEMDSKARKESRQKESKPVLSEIRKYLDWQALNVLPKSPLGQAVSYTLSNWEALNRYTEDGDLDIDNTAAERALRTVAIGRKNWMFAGSDNGGVRAAVIYSLVSTCKRDGIDPFEYLRDVLERVSTHPARRIEELLPHRWKSLYGGGERDSPQV